MTAGLAIPAITGVWLWVPGVLVAVFGAARLTRLIVHDHYPPMESLRGWWVRVTWNDQTNSEGRWGLLATCHWCAAPYVFALTLLSAYLTDLHWGWWLFWGWLAGAYATAMVVERDEKD